MPDPKLQIAARRIAGLRGSVSTSHSILVAVSGIDASGKGFITAQLASGLEAHGLRTAVINTDGWLNLPHIRFGDSEQGAHFYAHAFRFGALFNELVFPLQKRRSLRLTMLYAEETATAYRSHTYDFKNIDVILLEGIFLLKREFQHRYDLSIWIDCGFETALERAIARAQEGLTPEQTIAAYRKIYFPAQALHFERDDPQAAAGLTLKNDPRSASPGEFNP